MEVFRLKSERRLLLAYIFSTIPNPALRYARVDYDGVNVTKLLSMLQSGSREISIPIFEKGKKRSSEVVFLLDPSATGKLSGSVNDSPLDERRPTFARERKLPLRSATTVSFPTRSNEIGREKMSSDAEVVRSGSHRAMDLSTPPKASSSTSSTTSTSTSTSTSTASLSSSNPLPPASPKAESKPKTAKPGRLPLTKGPEKRNFAAVSFLDFDSSSSTTSSNNSPAPADVSKMSTPAPYHSHSPSQGLRSQHHIRSASGPVEMSSDKKLLTSSRASLERNDSSVSSTPQSTSPPLANSTTTDSISSSTTTTTTRQQQQQPQLSPSPTTASSSVSISSGAPASPAATTLDSPTTASITSTTQIPSIANISPKTTFQPLTALLRPSPSTEADYARIASLELLLSSVTLLPSSDMETLEAVCRVRLSVPKGLFRLLKQSSAVGGDFDAVGTAGFHLVLIRSHVVSEFSSKAMYIEWLSRHVNLLVSSLKGMTNSIDRSSPFLPAIRDDLDRMIAKSEQVLALASAMTEIDRGSQVREEDMVRMISSFASCVEGIKLPQGARGEFEYPYEMSFLLSMFLRGTYYDPEFGIISSSSTIETIDRVVGRILDDALHLSPKTKYLADFAMRIVFYYRICSLATLKQIDEAIESIAALFENGGQQRGDEVSTECSAFRGVICSLALLLEKRLSNFFEEFSPSGEQGRSVSPSPGTNKPKSTFLFTALSLLRKCRSITEVNNSRYSFVVEISSLISAGICQHFARITNGLVRPIAPVEWVGVIDKMESGFDECVVQFARQIDAAIRTASGGGASGGGPGGSIAVRMIAMGWNDAWRSDLISVFSSMKIIDEHVPSMMKSVQKILGVFGAAGVETPSPVNFNDVFNLPAHAWLAERKRKMDSFVKRALAADDWHPITRAGEGHSTSAVDLASLVQQTVPFLLNTPLIDANVYSLSLAECVADVILSWANSAALHPSKATYPFPTDESIAVRVASLLFVRSHMKKFTSIFDSKKSLHHSAPLLKLDQQLGVLINGTCVSMGVVVVKRSQKSWIDKLYVPNPHAARIDFVLNLFDPLLSDIFSFRAFLPEEQVIVAIESVMGELCRTIRNHLLTSKSVSYSDTNGPMIEADMKSIEEFFIARDDHGEPQGLSLKAAATQIHSLSALVNTLFSVPTDDLIDMHGSTPSAAGSNDSSSVLTKETIAAVLAHRPEKSAKRFHLKK